MNHDFVIIGGGCYGSWYVKQLLEARERGKVEFSSLLVLDQDPQCRVSKSYSQSDVIVHQTTWEDFGDEVFTHQGLKQGQMVPAPIAPHVIRHWLVRDLRSRGLDLVSKHFDGKLPEIPYAQVTDAGTAVLSHAPDLCPVNCIEPRLCPLTKDTRWWDMPDTVLDVARKMSLAALQTFVCRHYAYGVGTIAFSVIFEARSALENVRAGDRVGIATVSGCHGLFDLTVVQELEDR